MERKSLKTNIHIIIIIIISLLQKNKKTQRFKTYCMFICPVTEQVWVKNNIVMIPNYPTPYHVREA